MDQVRARIAEITRTTSGGATSTAAARDAGFASMLASAIGADGSGSATTPLAPTGSGPTGLPATGLASVLGGGGGTTTGLLGTAAYGGTGAGNDLLTTLGSLLANPALALSAQSSLAHLTAPGVTTAAGARLDAAGVPAELAGYGNGRIPDGALVAIDATGTERLWAPAAQAFDAMRTAAAADGVELGVTDSYRSYEDQVTMAREQGLYSQGGLAAAPGTSEHGWGRALDLDLDGTAQAWLQQHAGRFGFTAPVAGEPWHWEFGTS
jgi:hypothetical protein